MAAPVWVLSVDLQTKSATFVTGMSDAAKTARGSFTEIKAGANEMGRDVGVSMTEARHGVMLLGEEFGVHIPRGITTFIASLGPVGAAMEAAFPFLAIIVGATLLLEHLSKVKEATEKLEADQGKFSTAVLNAWNTLDDKILQAGIRADELRGNHFAALRKELELIDHQSMAELVRQFEQVAKAADAVFMDLKVHWYEQGSGSEGAKHALQQFKTQYDNLLAQKKDTEASNLLTGTLKTAQHILDLQKQAQSNQGGSTADVSKDIESYNKYVAASGELKKASVGFTEREVAAQQTLVDGLQALVGIQGRVNELKKIQKDNDTTATTRTVGDEAERMAWKQVQAEKKADAEAEREREQNYREAIARLEQTEKEKIEATEKGSSERLAAIDSAIKAENARGLQETGFYKSLLTSRIALVREMVTEEERVKAEAGKEAATHAEKMGELALAAAKEKTQLQRSARRVNLQQQTEDETEAANADFKIKMAAFEKEIAALDKHGKDYENKLKALQNKETELVQAHENLITQIKDKAQEAQNARILSGLQHLEDETARGLTSVLMRQESFGKMIVGIGDQVASGMIQNAIKSILADDLTKERDAAKAARKMYLAGTEFPFPANIVMAPLLGAAAFAATMAFNTGGIVPGVGIGDIVPAMLTPGETVLPKGLTEMLTNAAQFGQGQSGGDIHVHVHHNPTIHALDAEGMERVLKKNAHVLTKHFHNELRKMNR